MNRRRMSRRRILGLFGAVWGGSVLLHGLMTHLPASTNPNYAAGHNAATIFAAVMLVVGLYYLIKG